MTRRTTQPPQGTTPDTPRTASRLKRKPTRPPSDTPQQPDTPTDNVVAHAVSAHVTRSTVSKSKSDTPSKRKRATSAQSPDVVSDPAPGATEAQPVRVSASGMPIPKSIRDQIASLSGRMSAGATPVTSKSATTRPAASKIMTQSVPDVPPPGEPVRPATVAPSKRTDFLKLTPLMDGGTTFVIDGVTDVYQRQGVDIRAVRILMRRDDGQPVTRWIKCGVSVAAREAFLADALARWRAGGDERLFQFDDTFNIVPATAHVFTDLPADTAASQDSGGTGSQDTFWRDVYPDAQSYGVSDEEAKFVHATDPVSNRPVTIEIVRTDKGERAHIRFYARIEPLLLIQDDPRAPRASATLRFRVHHADGTATDEEERHSALTGSRDNPFERILMRDGLGGLNTSTVKRLGDLVGEMCRVVPSVMAQSFAGWTDPNASSLAYVAANSVQTAEGLKSFEDAGRYPPGVIEAEFTNPSDDEVSRMDEPEAVARQIEAVSDLLIRSAPESHHLTSLLMGHTVATLSPYACPDTPGLIPFMFEVFGRGGCGKNTIISRFTMAYGRGYTKRIQDEIVGTRRNGGSSGRHDVSVMARMNYRTVIAVDFLQTDKKHEIASHQDLISTVGTAAQTGVLNRDQSERKREKPKGGLITTANIDNQRRYMNLDNEASARRMTGVEMFGCSNPDVISRLLEPSSCEALALAFYKLRQRIIQSHTGPHNDAYRECEARASILCQPISDIDPNRVRSAHILVSGLLYFRDSMAAIYGDAGRDLIAWIDEHGVSCAVSYLKDRADALLAGSLKDRAELSRDIIRNVLAGLPADHGHYRLPRTCLTKAASNSESLMRTLSDLGVSLETLGYRFGSNTNLPASPLKYYVLGDITGSSRAAWLDIYSNSISPATPLIKTIRSAFKAEGLNEPTIKDVEALFDEICVPYEGDGRRRMRDDGHQVRGWRFAVSDIWQHDVHPEERTDKSQSNDNAHEDGERAASGPEGDDFPDTDTDDALQVIEGGVS